MKGRSTEATTTLPDVMVHNDAVSATRAQDSIVPGQSANTGRMTIQGSDLLHPIGVPDLNS